MQTHKIQIIAGTVIAAVLLVVVAALLRPSKPVVVSSRPGQPSATPIQKTDRPEIPPVATSGGKPTGSQTGTAGNTRTGDAAKSDPAGATGEGAATTPIRTGDGGTTSGMSSSGGIGSATGGDSGAPDGVALAGGATGTAGGAAGSGSGTSSSAASSGAGAKTSKDSGDGSTTDAALTTESDATPAPGQALIGGRVMRGEEAVSGASLTLEGVGRAYRAATDPQGQYQFPPVEPGEYRLTLLDPKTPSNIRSLMIEADGRLLGEDFSIPAGPVVHGQVMGYGASEGITGARVMIYKGNQYVTAVSTIPGGSFSTPPIDAGNYTFKVEAKGYQTKSEAIEVQYGDESGVFHLANAIELDPANAIEGKVLSPGGAPLGGARVALFSAGGSVWTDPLKYVDPTVTDASGFYRFSTLPAFEGSFQVGAWKEGLAPAFGPMLQLPEAAQEEAPPVQLGVGLTVTGRTLDTSNKPVANVQVGVSVQNGFPQTGRILQRLNMAVIGTTTKADGTFHLPGLEGGSFQVDVTVDNYIPQHPSVNSTEALFDLGDIKLKSDQEAEAGTIFGVIRDDLYHKYKVANCTLRCPKPPVSQFKNSDDNGAFRFDELPDGTYTLEVAGSTVRENNVWIPVNQKIGGLRPGESAVDVVFDLSGKVQIKVTDAGGNPIRRFKINVESRFDLPNAPPGVPYSVVAGYETMVEKNDGQTVIGNLIPGDHFSQAKIIVTAEGVGVETVTGIPVPSEGAGDVIQISVGEGGGLEGRVLGEFNQPLSGIEVVAEGSGNARTTRQTDSSGGFAFETLAAGTVTLTVGSGEWVIETVSGVPVEASQTLAVPDIILKRGGTITGRIYRGDGAQPASGIPVKCGPAASSTDATGLYTLQGAPAGEQQIVVSYQGSPDYMLQTTNVVAGETVTQDDIRLPAP